MTLSLLALILLALASFVSWFFSMLAGAGSPLILIPLVSVLCGSAAVAPVLTLGMLLGNGQRTVLLHDHIDWRVSAWFVPGAIAGALLGAYCFSLIRLDGLQWLIAIALILMAWHQWRSQPPAISLEASDLQLQGEPSEPGSSLRAWYFLPLAFFNGLVSALIGSTGPVLNPAYLSYGLMKESMIATKSFNNSMLHITKILAYLYFGVIHSEHWVYGLVIGAAALPGNWLGRMVLQRMSPAQFRQAVIAFVAFSGVFMLWRQVALAF